MNVLLIGSGGREHALAWALARSPRLSTLYVAPGNAGMAALAKNVDLAVDDHQAVIAFCQEHDISLVVVGPEAPLVDGLADSLRAASIRTFGPSAAAAQLEGSKNFTKAVCDRYNIPTSAYGHFTDAASARAYVEAHGAPIVIKADGLAAGKGVTVAMTMAEALAAIDACFDGSFGAAGAEVVIEEFLRGEEASLFALSDGQHVLALATAQDHKRAYDGDTGPNTGGMGAYSPAPVVTDAVLAKAMDEIVRPTIAGLASEGTPFQGILYAGLMIDEDGQPRLIEYNVRFGDPECQVLMTRLKSDLLDAIEAAVDGTLDQHDMIWHDDVAMTVVLAAKGYPGTYEKGTEIKGLNAAEVDDAVTIFHAGTKADGTRLLAHGGRVLNVTARGATIQIARDKAYKAVAAIDWPEGFCRSDIGWRALAREQDA